MRNGLRAALVNFRDMWKRYLQPGTLQEALGLLEERDEGRRVVAGGTDILVELQRGGKPADTLLDITKIEGLRYVRV